MERLVQAFPGMQRAGSRVVVAGLLLLISGMVLPAPAESEAPVPSIAEDTESGARYAVSVRPLLEARATNLDGGDGSRRLLNESRLILEEISQEMNRVFRLSDPVEMRVQPVPFEEFREATASSGWMRAIYRQGQVFIPIRPHQAFDRAALRRTLRHEFVHAVTDSLSGSRTPVWLDEGLAQLIEGSPAPAVERALCDGIAEGTLPELNSLNASFAGFSTEKARRAYGLSLFAVRSIVNRFGFPAIHAFLSALKENPDAGLDFSFYRTFGRQFADFETDVQLQLVKLASCRPRSLAVVQPSLRPVTFRAHAK